MSLEVRIRKKLAGFMLDVSFETEDEIFAVLGEAETGKTMMLKCIAGVETPDEGKIVLNGRVLYDSIEKINIPSYQRKVGLLFQDLAFFPTMTVEQNIRLALEGGGAEAFRSEYGMNKNSGAKSTKLALSHKVAEYLREYGLDGLGGEYPADLSCGQRQRAAMARMMAASPELVLLDEPFEKLDGYLKADLLYEIRDKLKNKNIPAVFASRDMDEVYAMAEKVCVIKKGRTLEVQDKKAFFRKPETISGALLTGCRNVADAVLLDPFHALVKDWGTIFCFGKANRAGATLEELIRNHSDRTEASDRVPGETEIEAGTGIETVSAERAQPGLPDDKWEKLPAGMSAIGIFAFDFTAEPPVDSEGKPLPCYRISVYPDRIDEDMRDYLVYFRPVRDPKSRVMLWQISKSAARREELEKVRHVYIENSKILKLKG